MSKHFPSLVYTKNLFYVYLNQEVKRFIRCLLVFARCLLLFDRCSLLFARFLLLFARSFCLVACYLFLGARFFFLIARQRFLKNLDSSYIYFMSNTVLF